MGLIESLDIPRFSTNTFLIEPLIFLTIRQIHNKQSVHFSSKRSILSNEPFLFVKQQVSMVRTVLAVGTNSNSTYSLCD